MRFFDGGAAPATELSRGKKKGRIEMRPKFREEKPEGLAVHSGGSGAAPHEQVRPEFVNKWLTPTLFLKAPLRRVSPGPQARYDREIALWGSAGGSDLGDEIEIVVDRADQAAGDLALVAGLLQEPLLFAVRETAELDQRRGNVRRLEHRETRRTVAVIEQPHIVPELGHELAGEADRHVVGL